MADDLFCPFHGVVQETLKEVKKIQEARRCLTNESDIRHLINDISEMKQENRDLWTSINNLRRMVYMGAGATGVLAFLGSILGAMLKK